MNLALCKCVSCIVVRVSELRRAPCICSVLMSVVSGRGKSISKGTLDEEASLAPLIDIGLKKVVVLSPVNQYGSYQG